MVVRAKQLVRCFPPFPPQPALGIRTARYNPHRCLAFAEKYECGRQQQHIRLLVLAQAAAHTGSAMSSPESDDGVAEYIQHLRAEYDVVVAERAHERKELYADADENDYEDHEPGFDQDPPPDDFLVNAESMVANVSAWAMYDAWEKSGEDQPGYQTPKEFADARMMSESVHIRVGHHYSVLTRATARTTSRTPASRYRGRGH